MVNSKIIECEIENVNEDYDIDVIQWKNFSLNIFKNLINDKEIVQNSCLSTVDYDKIFFDITFTDSNETHKLNKTYRNKDYPADIITFALFADDKSSEIVDRQIVLGDIIIALDKIQELAQQENKSFEWELKFLLAHGILHLLGFDHQTEEEYNFIVKQQIKAIEEL